MNALIEALSTWNVIRASGFTAYILIFISIMGGLMMKIGSSKTKPIYTFLHQHAGWLAFLVSMLHGATLLFDTYMPFAWYEVFIPFTAEYEPLLSGLGTLSFYGLILLLISSDLMKRMGLQIWKKVHLLAIPTFMIAFIHGALMGTDRKEIWAFFLYLGTASILVFLLLMRMWSTEAVVLKKEGQSSYNKAE